MTVRKLIDAPSLPDYLIAELLDGSYAAFLRTPSREVCEADLRELRYFRPVGNNGVEAKAYMYSMYGLEKEM